MTLSSHRFHSIAALTLIATTLAAVTGCHNVTPAVKSSASNAVAVYSIPVDVMKDYISGDYASADYDKRAQGYDWVGVMVRAESDQQVDIKVRSRSDIKKQTCQFDGKAILMGQDAAHGTIFQAQANDSTVFFQFKDNMLTIDSPNKYALNYFCSGGASLAGEYQKLTEDLAI
ncbi:hypothetical protein SAMN05660405_02191 [Psychrobacter pacificensis]|uniref:Lipoprotein n=1 Tax=Psychrobacter pacificensis TaxID=112002 RepID=A0A1G6ZTT8_9GAMM|nr:hypothetical protein [Psychrobacter pacificensis]GLR30012.1 hypothetical protein GCM10007915_22510 [Psychrobacter pacificensis]SDE05930.1 hypothetical protein SAMN05660405_02191 [Psychrobacter pacificensis]